MAVTRLPRPCTRSLRDWSGGSGNVVAAAQPPGFPYMARGPAPFRWPALPCRLHITASNRPSAASETDSTRRSAQSTAANDSQPHEPDSKQRDGNRLRQRGYVSRLDRDIEREAAFPRQQRGQILEVPVADN